MAASREDDIYFPSLATCLDGEHQLLSWNNAYVALTSEQQSGLEAFFRNTNTLDALSSFDLRPPADPFKKALDQRTAPISVTAGAGYEIKELKEDAVWLSEQANINQEAALRVVILEWQTRAATKLREGLSEGEQLSVQDAVGARFGTSLLGELPPIAAQATDFNSQPARRRRLLKIHLSERVHAIKVSSLLLRVVPLEQRSRYTKTEPWLEPATNSLLSVVGLNDADLQRLLPTKIEELLGALQDRFDRLDRGSGWFVEEDGDPLLEELWNTAQITELTHLLLLLSGWTTALKAIPSPSIVMAWFTFASQMCWFMTLAECLPTQAPACGLIQSLISSISATMLSVRHSLQFLDDLAHDPSIATASDPTPYFMDRNCVQTVHQCFVHAARLGPGPAAPAMLGWALIMWHVDGAARTQRNERANLLAEGMSNSTASTSNIGETSVLEDCAEVINSIVIEEDENSLELLGANAIAGGNAYQIMITVCEGLYAAFYDTPDQVNITFARMAFVEVARFSLEIAQYSEDVLSAIWSSLKPYQCFWDMFDERYRQSDPVLDLFFNHDDLVYGKLVQEAKLRYPFELRPFLELCEADFMRHNKDSIMDPKNMRTFTYSLPEHFSGYSLRGDMLYLDYDFPIFAERNLGPRRLTANGTGEDDTLDSDLILPANTVGQPLQETRPPVAYWDHPHSALVYFAACLTTIKPGSNIVLTFAQSDIDLVQASAIIDLFTKLLTFTLKAHNTLEGKINVAQAFLDDVKCRSWDRQDIINVISDIFEQQLQRHVFEPGAEGSRELLVSCIQFFCVVATPFPNRIISLLARSRLLERDGQEGALVAIVTGTEIVLASYPFLVACVRLLEALVQAVPGTSVISRLDASTSNNLPLARRKSRFQPKMPKSEGLPERITKTVFNSFQKTFVGLFGSSLNWRFDDPSDRLTMYEHMIEEFDHIIRIAYGLDDSTGSKKLTGPLAEAAENTLEMFLSPATNNQAIRPLLEFLEYALHFPSAMLSPAQLGKCYKVTTITLRFCSDLLNIGILFDLPTSHLEEQLFKALPLLTKFFAIDGMPKQPVAELLGAMLESAGRSAKEPPSLLGHLGSGTAVSFLDVLMKLDRNLIGDAAEISIWNMLSAIVSNRQQWFAIYIITGSDPRARSKARGKDAASSTSQGPSLLKKALDLLSTISELKPDSALAMLRFVAAAQSHWPWAMGDLKKHTRFTDAILDFIGTLKRNENAETLDDVQKTCDEDRIAAYVAEILAMQIHAARETGNFDVARKVAPKLAYFRVHGVAQPKYNDSLHTNLAKNLEQAYPGIKVGYFKRSQLFPRNLGPNYFYDVDFATNVLNFKPGWAQRNGWCDEMKRANSNLSLVEAQVLLMKSWKLLAIELCSVMAHEPRLPTILGETVDNCLKANTESKITVFERIKHVRADFAFVVLQKLIASGTDFPSKLEVFPMTWDTIRASGQNFDAAFSAGDPVYYRTLLKTLFLSIQPHLTVVPPQETSKSKGGFAKFTTRASDTILEVLGDVVARGFKSLSALLHETFSESDEKEPASSANDFVVLTAILQSILRIPSIAYLHSQIALLFATSHTSRYAVSLFSWSDRLTMEAEDGSPDPIYGEMTVLFLLEMSSVPAIAEQMAVEGVLSSLAAANICTLYRRPKGMGPFDQPPRMHAIWTKGLLPILINLLDAVGPPMANEVVGFVNQFPQQLKRNEVALDNERKPARKREGTDGAITLSMASETHSLALLWKILDTYRQTGAASGALVDEIQEMDWDANSVKGDVEAWLEARSSLGARIVPLGERESAWRCGRLEDLVVSELQGTMACLEGGGNGGA
ncbi:hypothetical protein K402DRAFT_465561 [Aulographum hederae CBS 113979]|uniref:Uncharacterized protein n=1 Tax=Aulographum hederae CBS 113979 TaxID=1176131 RepID=A0A6G1GSM1_9PEZI|nr:hypothetical protein K402DRAFT_465561 [Aulographum hederae CBS 113979]